MSRKLVYKQCQKRGFHDGEDINIVCIEPQCKDNNLICAICLEEEHENHKFRSLRSVLSEITNKLNSKVFSTLNKQELKEILDSSKQSMLEDYNQLKNDLMRQFYKIEENIQKYHQIIQEQTKMQELTKENIEQDIGKLQTEQISKEELLQTAKKFIELFQIQKKNSETFKDKNLDEEEIQFFVNKQIREKFAHLNAESRKQLLDQLKSLTKCIDKQIQKIQEVDPKPLTSLFENSKRFWFSQEYCSNGLVIENEFTVSSKNKDSSYRFCFMEPPLPLNEKSTFGFKYNRTNGSDWIAFGIGYPKYLKSKDFAFNYSQTGHGSYMISSNSGTWSHISSEFNNVCKAFNFSQDQVIQCIYDPKKLTLEFINLSDNDQKYTLQVEQKQDDPLCICCLFYYDDQKIEFLNDPVDYFKKQQKGQ